MPLAEDVPRYRIDDLRRMVAALATANGFEAARAAAFASYLLWFDTAGYPRHGVTTLPDWHRRIAAGEFDAASEGTVAGEHPGTVVLDARSGFPPTVLARAAALAAEKARDVGVGLVRIRGLAPCAPSTPLAAEMALGPEVGCILGPGPCWALAVPSGDGLPAVCDPGLNKTLNACGTDLLSQVLPGALGVLPWSLFAAEGDMLVCAVALKAFEPLATFHERVAAALRGLGEVSGLLLPSAWSARRREAREHGLRIDPAVWRELSHLAARYVIPEPQPVAAVASTSV
jgi:LDH2 family malate/lactate/ureidoglycolate dehydrogenase